MFEAIDKKNLLCYPIRIACQSIFTYTSNTSPTLSATRTFTLLSGYMREGNLAMLDEK